MRNHFSSDGRQLMGATQRLRSGRKALGVLGATAAGLALLYSYRSHASIATVLPTPPKAVANHVTRFGIGESAYSPNGPVKVEIWVTGRRITDVEALSLPNDNAHSIELSNYAGPKLRKQALAAQSASIHGVSGATMTSTAYEQSLQSAIDRVRGVSVTGLSVPTDYGPLQVEIDLLYGHIADVRAIKLPEDDSLAASLSNYAAPILGREAVDTQSSKIRGVSGATMTTDAYRQSLQSAIDASNAHG
jgi:uncharacterized protein with FMN-binding domain